MNIDQQSLRQSAFRAYERGQLIRASSVLLVTVPTFLWSLSISPNATVVTVTALALSLLAAYGHWRGNVFRAATYAGLSSGLALCVLPYLVICQILERLGNPEDFASALCIALGVGVGCYLHGRANRLQEGQLQFILITGLITVLMAMMGCFFMSVGTLVGVSLGIMIPLSTLVISTQKHS